MTRGLPLFSAGASVLLVAGLAVWGWTLDPQRHLGWAVYMFFLPAFWGYVEIAQGGTLQRERAGVMNWHRWTFAGAGLLFALRLGPRLAVVAGLLDAAWLPTATRVWWIVFGVAMAAWGNYLPKLLSPWGQEDQPFDWPRVHRFAGWLFTLAGLAIAAVCLTVPAPEAATFAERILLAVCLLAVARKLVSLSVARVPDRPV